jgi:acyl-coenzyme A synthetase/AMP-(fatty) acid ligase
MKITFITGRVDDVLMAGHRLFNFRNGRNCIIPPTAAECAVIGINDALKGHPLALVVTKLNDSIEHFQLEQEIIKLVRQTNWRCCFKKRSHRGTFTQNTLSERPSEN